ncbi:hypothetical protein [Actinoplanes utahensis]|uniref:Ribosomal protein L7/L12 C-terminal domain-containing protein n=1 Tax=Actinoplanes utahensis TaxID=1869 RepID=A0A0A6USB5_ACTUT|nr:hypothetical protein [Actinoplanes utahensis]KHD77878.1 hypothetical protein MB27_08865 [Actinoplanes utahensis]GIF32429.1 hypothetical protein Aut01nite_54150 [Actinoplanes utahensis]
MMITIALLVGAVGVGMLLVSGVLRRSKRSAPEHPADAGSLHAEVRALLAEDGDTAAVRLYRRRTGAGLVEAKDAVERIAREQQ